MHERPCQQTNMKANLFKHNCHSPYRSYLGTVFQSKTFYIKKPSSQICSMSVKELETFVFPVQFIEIPNSYLQTILHDNVKHSKFSSVQIYLHIELGWSIISSTSEKHWMTMHNDRGNVNKQVDTCVNIAWPKLIIQGCGTGKLVKGQ